MKEMLPTYHFPCINSHKKSKNLSEIAGMAQKLASEDILKSI